MSRYVVIWLLFLADRPESMFYWNIPYATPSSSSSSGSSGSGSSGSSGSGRLVTVFACDNVWDVHPYPYPTTITPELGIYSIMYPWGTYHLLIHIILK